MNRTKHNSSLLTIFIALLAVVLFHPGFAFAEEMPETEAQVVTEGAEYTGTINSVTPEQSVIIIDDRAFILDRIVRFNNATWSREQVMKRLKPGNQVEIEIGRVIDPSRGAHVVVSLRLLGQ